MTPKNASGRMPPVTTLSQAGVKEMKGIAVEFSPGSLHWYTVAKNTLERRKGVGEK